MVSYNYLRKNILEIPFSKEFVTENLDSLKTHSSWLIGAAQALINKEFKLIKNDFGLISATLTLEEFGNTHSKEELNWWQGVVAYLNKTPRGDILAETQTKSPNYGALVPLFLAAFKIYRDVGYSEWDWTDPKMKIIVDKDLLDAVTLGSEHIIPKEDLILARNYSLEIKSGKGVGGFRKPEAQYTVYSRAFSLSSWNDLPRLRKVMDCQLWLAHPKYRTKYMVLNIHNLDNMPEPLLDSEFIIPTKETIEEDLSWS